MKKRDIKFSPFVIACVVLNIIFILTACNKVSNEKQAENVCTLTPEQIPEIRGFKLGMTFDQIKHKFPTVCEYVDNEERKLESLMDVFENSRSDIFYGNKDYKIVHCRFNESESDNYTEYPEMKGVNWAKLGLQNGVVSGFKIKYPNVADSNFKTEFRRKTEEALNLSSFTNWRDSEFPFGFTSVTNQQHILLCNKVEIDINTLYFDKTYNPSLVVRTVNQTARTSEQIRSEEEKKKVEEKRKSETFKP